MKLNDAYEVQFDFGDGSETAPTARHRFSDQNRSACARRRSRVFELPHGVCEKAVNLRRPATFVRSTILQRRSNAHVQKLLRPKTDTAVRLVAHVVLRHFWWQPDGKIGFDSRRRRFKGRRARRRCGGRVRVLGSHPKDKQPVELHSGRYGPYVKHGAVNATLPDTDQVDSLTLAQALDLLAAKAKKGGGRSAKAPPKRAAAKPVRRTRAA